MEVNFLDTMLNPQFLIIFGLVLAGFLPLALSVWVTWKENTEEED